jgi:hypothetical protein
MIRLVFEGDPIRYYDCGNRHSRGGEEDDQSSAEDNASGQHPSVVVYASHLALWAGAPEPTTRRESQHTFNLKSRDWKFGVTVGNSRSGVRSLAGEGGTEVRELLSDTLVAWRDR